MARPKLDVPRVERRQTQRVDASAAGPARARARDQQEQEKPWEPPTRKEFEEICKRMRTAEAAGDKRKRERDQAQSKAEAFFNQNKKLTGDLEDARAQIGRLTEDLQRASQAEEAQQAVARAADTRARKAEAEVQAAEERAAASEQEVERVSTNYSNLRRLNASLETQMVTTGGRLVTATREIAALTDALRRAHQAARLADSGQQEDATAAAAAAQADIQLTIVPPSAEDAPSRTTTN